MTVAVAPAGWRPELMGSRAALARNVYVPGCSEQGSLSVSDNCFSSCSLLFSEQQGHQAISIQLLVFSHTALLTIAATGNIPAFNLSLVNIKLRRRLTLRGLIATFDAWA